MNSKRNNIIFIGSSAGVLFLLALALFPSIGIIFKGALNHDRPSYFIFDQAIAGIALIIALDFSVLVLTEKKRALFVFSACFIIAMIFFWMRVNYSFVSNSDSANFLVLAKHLADTNKFLSADIYYGNWLPVFDPATLLYAPLFKIFSSWALVRTIGKLLIWLAEIASYAFMARQLRVKWSVILFTSVFFLLPLNSTLAFEYMIITQYNLYFVLCFLIIGLYLRMANRKEYPFACMTALSLCALFAGLSGIRLVLVFFVPFLCVFFYETVKNRNKTALLFYNNHTFKERLIGLKNPGVFAGVFFVLGYMILSVILARIFFFKSYETSSQFLADPNDFLDHAGKVFMGLLELFGFTFNASVLSLTGLCNITAFLFLFLLIIKAKNYLKNGGSPEKTFVIKFICAGFFFNTFVFVFSLAAFDDYNRFLLRYYIPTTIFFIPLAALVLNDNFKSFSSKLTVALIVFHVFVTGANVIPQYVRFLETGTQTKTPAAGFLKDRGYKLGLATFWNSAVMQEITDGKVQFATVELYNDEKTPVSFYRYFTPKEYERKMNEAGFILLSKEEYETYKTGAYFINREIKYEDQWFVVLEL